MELGQSLGKQLFFSQRSYGNSLWNDDRAGICPGFSDDSVFRVSALFGAIAYGLREGGILREAFDKVEDENKASSRRKEDAKKEAAAGSPDEALESLLQVDTLMIELGYGLVTMADPAKGGDLLQRITGVRKSFAQTWVSSFHPFVCETVFSLAPTSTNSC